MMSRDIFVQLFNAHAQKRPRLYFWSDFNWKFEILVDHFLFDYEIWWHLLQDLSVFRA